MKKLYTILILFTFFISFANTTYADTNYYYQIIMGGELKEISWPTKTQCEADYATVLTEYKNTVVKGCYLGSKLPATPPIVIPPGTLYWFTNAQYQLQNFPDGYPTIDSCNTASAAFSKSAGMTIVKPCVAMTLAVATAQHATETLKPVDNAVPIGAKVGLAENKSVYTMLAPIGNITHMDSSGSDACKNDPTCIPNDIGTYLNIIFKLAIGICSALAVIMLIINGVKYMGDESVFGKTEAKKNMFGSIVGLLIALGAWALLNTINPALTGQNGLNISSVNIELDGDAQAPITVNRPSLTSLGISCPGSGGQSSIPAIAASFAGKMTYSQQLPKGQGGPNNTVLLDCSGYVNAILECAGINNTSVNSGTSVIFGPNTTSIQDKNKTTDTSIDGVPLQIGDLVGWPPQDNAKGNGHVMIYIGNGNVVNDCHGGKVNGVYPTGQCYGTFPLTKYKSQITHIKRISTL